MGYGETIQRFLVPTSHDLNASPATVFTWTLPSTLSITIKRISVILTEAVAANGGQGVIACTVDATEIATIQPAASDAVGKEVLGVLATAPLAAGGKDVAGGSTILTTIKTQGTGTGAGIVCIHYQEIPTGV